MPKTTTLDPDLITVESEVEAFIPTLRQTLEQGKEHERQLREAAKAQREENYRIERALRAFLPKEPKAKGAPHRKTVSQNRLDMVMAYIHKQEGEVTGVELTQHFSDWGAGVVSSACKMLREQERIRFTGMRKLENGRKSKAYAIDKG